MLFQPVKDFICYFLHSQTLFYYTGHIYNLFCGIKNETVLVKRRNKLQSRKVIFTNTISHLVHSRLCHYAALKCMSASFDSSNIFFIFSSFSSQVSIKICVSNIAHFSMNSNVVILLSRVWRYISALPAAHNRVTSTFHHHLLSLNLVAGVYFKQF